MDKCFHHREEDEELIMEIIYIYFGFFKNIHKQPSCFSLCRLHDKLWHSKLWKILGANFSHLDNFTYFFQK